MEIKFTLVYFAFKILYRTFFFHYMTNINALSSILINIILT